MIVAVGININIITDRGINHTFVTRDREIIDTFTGGREIKDIIVETIHWVVLLLTVNMVIMVWVP